MTKLIFFTTSIGMCAALHAAPTTIPLVSPSLLNGSFENGSGNTTITGWHLGFGTGEAQRKPDNASIGSWSLVVGQGSGAPDLGASVITNHSVVENDSFDLSFKWIPKSQWDDGDQIKWRLFTSSDDTTSGISTEIASGTASGFANGSAYQTATFSNISGVTPSNEDRKLWLQILRGSSSFGEFARVDEVTLSVTTDPQASYVALSPESQIAYYPLEDSADDYSATKQQYSGSWNTSEAYAAGTVGAQSADLTGSNDSISLPHTLSRDFTLSFWLKTTSTASSGAQWWHGHGILDGSTTGVSNDIGVSLNGSKIAFGAGNPDTTIFSQTSVNDGNWHHVAVQRHNASGDIRLFIDGTLESNISGPASSRDSSSPLTLGALSSGNNFINANIDDLRIFDETLDAVSIAKLHTTTGDYDSDTASDLHELIAVSAWADASESVLVPSVKYEAGSTDSQLTFDASAGRTYTVQRSSSLTAASWAGIGVSATPKYHGSLTLTDPSPPAAPVFYRVVISGHGPPLEKKPNIVIIYGDDVGYGDVSAYNPTGLISTPNIDQLAAEGLRFTDGHCSASTCSPSRFSMLTGVLAFREGVSIIPPTGALAIDPSTYTLPDMLKDAGYNTAVVGKWHLGLGNGGTSIDWNGNITPGPLEIGFDTCFMIPTTNDRVPCVYLKDHNIVGLDPSDPLHVHNSSIAAVNVAGSTQYPDGITTPSAMTYYFNTHGHNNSVINGIGRIGYMSGGQTALLNDESMAQDFLQEAKNYISAQDGETPFFLYFASQDIHVPRAPHPDFQGATGLGYRGDAMVQFDWVTGEIIQALKDAGLDEDTIVIFSSDNGPVYDDGYDDGTTIFQSSQDVDNGHDGSGIYRGGKYSILEGGTRVPFIVRWPAKIQPGVSDALVNQVDFIGSFASLLDVDLPNGTARDSRDTMDALLGNDPTGLPFTVEQNNGSLTALRVGNMKYTSQGRLYDLSTDVEELTDLSSARPTVAAKMAQQLSEIISGSGVRN